MTTKICAKCKTSLELDKFYKRARSKDGFQSFCKDCSIKRRVEYYHDNKEAASEYRKGHQKKRKAQFIEYKKSLKCSRCGDGRWYVLDFHHTSTDKEFNVSSLAQTSYSWNKILKEIKKCEVLCSNCHREVHYLLK